MDDSTPPPAILLTDHDPLVLALLAYYVGQVAPDYSVVTAATGQRALHCMAEQRVRLLITDYLLPDMDGLQLAAFVKHIAPATYVILASADDSPVFRQQLRAQSVDLFLPKQDIVARLGDVLRSVLLGEQELQL